MMSKHDANGHNQMTMIIMDDLVPKDHLVRKIDQPINFDFIYPIVESTYSTLGPPSIDPVVLVRIVFIQYLFGIRSMRQTIKELKQMWLIVGSLVLILTKRFLIFQLFVRTTYVVFVRQIYLKKFLLIL